MNHAGNHGCMEQDLQACKLTEALTKLAKKLYRNNIVFLYTPIKLIISALFVGGETGLL